MNDVILNDETQELYSGLCKRILHNMPNYIDKYKNILDIVKYEYMKAESHDLTTFTPKVAMLYGAIIAIELLNAANPPVCFESIGEKDENNDLL